MQKKSIYVAYTGGTIGMQRSEQGYIPVSGHLQRQLALMPEFHRPEMPDFTIHEYTPLMDSSDMYSAAIFLIPICISFDTAEKRRYATYLILNRRFSFEF